MNQTHTKLPDHERAYRALRDMILTGELAPGQAVTIQGLVDLLGLGMTPAREAIRRLTSEGALSFKGNRRVSVPEMDAHTYDQLAFARLAVEPELARRAVPRLDQSTIATLESLDAKVDDSISKGDVRGYLEGNRLFHVRLYERADAPVLLSISNMLWLRTGPSLRVMLGRAGTANLPDQHQEALAAMRAGDAEGVAEAIRADIEQGIRQVRSSLATEDEGQAPDFL